MRMVWHTVVVLLLGSLYVQAQDSCKKPYVEERLLADDVRYASPFYVIALPKTARTAGIDNVCYTYFENKDDTFFHIMSITYSNGSNTYYTYSKQDISNRMGLAEGTEALTDSQCVFHDYTLKPICNNTVFILYRCFIEGNCNNIDIGITPGVDVRLVLAANPHVSAECRRETEQSLKITKVLAGGDYMILPQKLKPQCITAFNNTKSIGYDRAVGSKEVTENDVASRFGVGDDSSNSQTKPEQVSRPFQAPQIPVRSPGTINAVQQQGTKSSGRPQVIQSSWNQQTNPQQRPLVSQTTPNRGSWNPYGVNVNSRPWTFSSTQAGSAASAQPGYTPALTQSNMNQGQWSIGPSPWPNQGSQPGSEVHYHMWTSEDQMKATMARNPNYYYHIHSWENMPPCRCSCN